MELVEHWHHHPPAHELLASFLGYEPSIERQPTERTPNDVARDRAVVGGEVIPFRHIPSYARDFILETRKKKQHGH